MPGRIYRSGERFQIVIESNTEGYLAVVQEGSDGRAGLFSPPRRPRQAESRPAHTKVVLPGARQTLSLITEPEPSISWSYWRGTRKFWRCFRCDAKWGQETWKTYAVWRLANGARRISSVQPCVDAERDACHLCR